MADLKDLKNVKKVVIDGEEYTLQKQKKALKMMRQLNFVDSQYVLCTGKNTYWLVKRETNF